MRCTLAILLCALLHQCFGKTVNYCGARMCGRSNAHTFCQYPEGPSPRCTGYMEAHLSMEEKARIMARLNRRRSEVAVGRLRRMPSAGNMLKLRWVEELAREAQRWADQCRPPQTPEEHDDCRDLYSITVGQCVASVVGEAPGLRAESMVDMWYMQSMLYKGNVTSYIAPLNNISYYGDFAQIVWSRTFMVGCGRSRFMIPWQGRLRSVERLVCNFAPRGPTPGRAMWTPAAPAEACPPRSLPDPELPGLCSFQYHLDESSDVDNLMTLEEHALLTTVLEVELNEVLNYLGSIDELYLTKMAIVTMDNAMTTVPYYNSIHKRELFESFVADNEIMNLSNMLPEEKLKLMSNATIILSVIEETTKNQLATSKKKLKLIGRPKSYNIEELGNLGDVTVTECNNQIPDDLPKKRKEFYAEYGYLDQEENLLENDTFISDKTSTEEQPESTITTESVNINNLNTSLITLSVTIDNGTIKAREMIILINKTNDSLGDAQKDDDYLNDPETVRELQEVLERMEKSLETTTPPSLKVRRELREHPKATDNSNVEELDVTPNSSKQPQASDDVDNKTLDKAPMLNMVLKYMPYLKPYQSDILGSVVSRGFTTFSSTVSYCIILVMYLY